MLEIINIIKEKFLNGLALFKEKIGKENFRKIVFILFCVILFIFSSYVSKNYLITGAYRKFILVILPIVLYAGLKYPGILFYCFIFCLPYTDFPSSLIGLRFDAFSLTNMVLAFLMIVYLFICIMNNKILITKTYLDIPIMLIIIIFLISIIQTRHVTFIYSLMKDSIIHKPYYRTIFQVLLLTFEISSLYITLSILKKREDVEKTVRVWIYSATIVSLLGLYGYFGYKLGLPLADRFVVDLVGRLQGTLKEPIFFGFFMSSTLPVLYSLIISKTNFMPKKYLYSCFAIQIIAVFLSASRATWIAFVLTIILMTFLNLKTRNTLKKTILMLSIFVAIVAVVFSVFIISMAISSKGVETAVLSVFIGKDFSALSRLDSMATAWNMFKAYPVLGAGFGNFYLRFMEFIPPYHNLLYSWIKGFYMPGDANNLFLTVLAETGIVGLAAILLMFFMLIKNISKTINTTGSEYWKTLLRGYRGSIFYMLILYFFMSTLTLTFIWTLFGLIMAIQRQCAQESKQQ